MATPPSPPSPSDNIKYFLQHPQNTWDLIGYLEWCRKLGDYEHDVALSRWVRSLESIANDPAESEDRRTKAQILREKYKRRSEKDRARQWLAPENSGTGGKDRKKPKITIFKNKGSFINAINAGSDVHIGHIETSKAPKRPLDNAVGDDKAGGSADIKRPKNKNPPDDVMDGSSLDEAFKLFESTYKQQPSSGQDELLKSIIHNAVTDHYQKGSAWLTKGSPILSWIIDLNDPEVTGWFLDEELAQLRDRMKALPSPDEHFAYSVNRFAKANTAEEYQTILETVPCRLPNVAYDRTKHFDAAWVNFVIQAMLALFGCYSNLDSCCNFREGWFDSNIWAPLIDHCLLGLDGVVVQRKEIKCFALKLIGNNNLRYDAIIHTARDFAPIEYAAIEVSRSIENEESLPAKKYVSDGTKLVTGMHSMLRRLHMLVDRDEEAIKDLQVVGMLNEGLNMQILRMTGLPSGLFLLSRGAVRSVPTNIGDLGSIFPLMNSIGMFKAIIRESIAAIAQYKAKKAAKKDDAGDLYQQVMGQNEL